MRTSHFLLPCKNHYSIVGFNLGAAPPKSIINSHKWRMPNSATYETCKRQDALQPLRSVPGPAWGNVRRPKMSNDMQFCGRTRFWMWQEWATPVAVHQSLLYAGGRNKSEPNPSSKTWSDILSRNATHTPSQKLRKFGKPSCEPLVRERTKQAVSSALSFKHSCAG